MSQPGENIGMSLRPRPTTVRKQFMDGTCSTGSTNDQEMPSTSNVGYVNDGHIEIEKETVSYQLENTGMVQNTSEVENHMLNDLISSNTHLLERGRSSIQHRSDTDLYQRTSMVGHSVSQNSSRSRGDNTDWQNQLMRQMSDMSSQFQEAISQLSNTKQQLSDSRLAFDDAMNELVETRRELARTQSKLNVMEHKYDDMQQVNTQSNRNQSTFDNTIQNQVSHNSLQSMSNITPSLNTQVSRQNGPVTVQMTNTNTCNQTPMMSNRINQYSHDRQTPYQLPANTQRQNGSTYVSQGSATVHSSQSNTYPNSLHNTMLQSNMPICNPSTHNLHSYSRNVSGGQPNSVTNRVNSQYEPKTRLPSFNGRGNFKSFWVLFDIAATKFQWDDYRKVEELLFCLEGEALNFVVELPNEARSNISLLKSVLENRYGECDLPEVNRSNLQNVRRYPRESLAEYSSRVTTLVHKAYPGLNNTELFTSLAIENILKGLNDRSLSYEISTKSPRSVEETIKLIMWHECCKNNMRQNSVECGPGYDQNDEIQKQENVRRMGNTRYVTEERLEQRLQHLTKEINANVSEVIKDELNSFKKTQNSNKFVRNQGPREIVCYGCNEKGHMKSRCPQLKSKGNNQSHGEKEQKQTSKETGSIARVEDSSEVLN